MVGQPGVATEDVEHAAESKSLAQRAVPVLIETARRSLFFGSSLPIGLCWFVALTPMIMFGMVSLVFWVGIPVLALVTVLLRGGAVIERLWLRATLGADIPLPYRSAPEGGPLRKLRVMITDPATWRDLVYAYLRLPLGIVETVAMMALWGGSLAMLLAPVYYWAIPDSTPIAFNISWFQLKVDSLPAALVAAAIGALGLGLTVLVVRVLTILHVGLAKLLLGPTSRSALHERAEHLQTSRARGIDAAEAERRRIERDLHDGAQQRLVAVAMDLGRAKLKLDNDPQAARQLIDEAHVEAKHAIAELRDVARGIYPAVLGDRGLDAALSSLAGRCPVPVHVTVELPDRPPAVVESTAYYIVAESLTNIAKHAEANTVVVTVLREGDRVLLEIYDDGKGGAIPTRGGGLVGLGDRAATIDGVLTVDSPLGGPTKIRAELPCTW